MCKLPPFSQEGFNIFFMSNGPFLTFWVWKLTQADFSNTKLAFSLPDLLFLPLTGNLSISYPKTYSVCKQSWLLLYYEWEKRKGETRKGKGKRKGHGKETFVHKVGLLSMQLPLFLCCQHSQVWCGPCGKWGLCSHWNEHSGIYWNILLLQPWLWILRGEEECFFPGVHLQVSSLVPNRWVPNV